MRRSPAVAVQTEFAQAVRFGRRNQELAVGYLSGRLRSLNRMWLAALRIGVLAER